VSTFWQYLLVLLTAAVPVLEVLVVVPASVAAGLHPLPVAILAFAGNAATLTLVVLGSDRLAEWLEGRAIRRGASGRTVRRTDRRRERIRRILARWGLPGMAVLAPLTVGTHVAALGAIAMRLPRRHVLTWSLGGLGAWTVVLTIVSATGRSLW
jgi:Ca2+/H+ antiporter, TMEM165/GDT1 family